MPVKLYFTTGISNWLCVNSDSVDTQQPITRARGVWVSLLRRRSWGFRISRNGNPQLPNVNMVLTNRNPVWFGGFYLLKQDFMSVCKDVFMK